MNRLETGEFFYIAKTKFCELLRKFKKRGNAWKIIFVSILKADSTFSPGSKLFSEQLGNCIEQTNTCTDCSSIATVQYLLPVVGTLFRSNRRRTRGTAWELCACASSGQFPRKKEMKELCACASSGQFPIKKTDVGVVRMRQLRTVFYNENRCCSFAHAPAEDSFL